MIERKLEMKSELSIKQALRGRACNLVYVSQAYLQFSCCRLSFSLHGAPSQGPRTCVQVPPKSTKLSIQKLGSEQRSRRAALRSSGVDPAHRSFARLLICRESDVP